VKEIDGSKGARYEWVDALAPDVHLGVGADVGEDVAVAHLYQREFAVVAMGAKVLQTVEGLAETPQRLAEMFRLALPVAARGVEAAEVDTPREAEAEVPGTRRPVARLVGDVVLHGGPRIDLGLDGAHWSAQARVVR
jgi:hypothetical protein